MSHATALAGGRAKIANRRVACGIHGSVLFCATANQQWPGDERRDHDVGKSCRDVSSCVTV
jgi:hypothetical protein